METAITITSIVAAFLALSAALMFLVTAVRPATSDEDGSFPRPQDNATFAGLAAAAGICWVVSAILRAIA